MLWRNGSALQNDATPGSTTPEDYTFWRQHFGETSGPTGPSALTTGFVRYVTSFSGVGAGAAVPEPVGIILVGIGIGAIAAGSRRRNG